MPQSTPFPGLLPTPLGERWQPLAQSCSRWQHDLVALLERFLDQPLTPTAFCQFEAALQTLLQRCGRTVLEWTVQQLEAEPLPAQVCRNREYYRLRPKSP